MRRNSIASSEARSRPNVSTTSSPLTATPKTAVPLAVVGRDAIDFLNQRTLDIHLKGVAKVERAEKPIHGDEQSSDLCSVALRKRADGYLFLHDLMPADELPRILAGRPQRPIGAERIAVDEPNKSRASAIARSQKLCRFPIH